ncbi:phage tail tape measure protein [Paenibacillus illinoisensis]|uniref:Phage tail tape measure protein n=1 Tax=Paenibacillus illinoisensis TaxID=59845 RepID=A0ABW8HZ44_9BACL
MASINAVFNFQDRISRKLSRPTKALEKVARTADNTNKMFRKLSRLRVNPRIGVKDQATRKMRTITRSLNDIGSKVATATIRVKDNASRAISNVESRLDGLATKTLALGAVAGVSSVGMFSAGASAYESDARASAITNLDPSSVTNIADSIYYDKNIGSSRNDVVQALVDYTQQTKLEGKALREAVEGTAKYAQMYGTDISETARGFASGFKNELGSFTEIADVSAFVMKNAGDQYDDYLDSLNEYSSTFKDLRLNIAQVGAAYIAAVQSGGRNFDEPSDMFREFNIRRNEMTDTQITAMSRLLGKDRTREIYKAMDAGTLSGQQVLFEYATALSKLPSEAQKAAYATELLGTKYEDLKEPMLAAAEAIGDPVKATEELSKQFDAFQGNNPMTEINKTTRTLGKSLKNIGQSMLVSVTPAFEELNKWATSPEGQKSISNFTKSISELAGVFAADFATGIRYVIDNWDELLPYLKFGAKFLAGLFIVTKVTKFFRELAPVFMVAGKTMKVVWNVAKWLGSGILSLGRGFVTILKWAKPFIPWVVRVGGTLLRFLPVIGWVITALGLLWGAWKNWDTITSIVSNAFQGAKDVVAESVNWILRKINWMIQKLNGLSIPLPENLGGPIGFNISEIPLMETKQMRDNNKTAATALQNTNFPNLIKGFDGSHAKGISDVPFDNYAANLHKGETVLPAEEASLIRDMAGSRTTGGSPASGSRMVNINITGDNYYSNEMDAKKVVKIIKDALKNEHDYGPSGVQMV